MIERLRAAGIVITHDWTHCPGYDRKSSLEERQAWARLDLEGVRSAEVVWIMVPAQSSVGASAEMGGALIDGTCTIVSGPNLNQCIFYDLCERIDTHEEAFEEIMCIARDLGKLTKGSTQ